MDIIAFSLSAVLLTIYLAWGVRTLRLRYRYHAELSMAFEGATLGAVAFFYCLEVALLKTFLYNSPILLLLTVLGLAVSGTALYGPMLISLTSQLLVDMITPRGAMDLQAPRYAPAEALERQGDYESALQEYRVMARIFPQDATSIIRIADNLAKLGQMEEAAERFEQGLKLMDSPEKSLSIVNRLNRIYTSDLDRPACALQVFENYLERFPDAEYAPSVRMRMESLQRKLAD